jgi:glycosyltransferase involved in cell wall biosynthesis
MHENSRGNSNVILATAGKFHAFSLACEYEKLGRLKALYASHRKWRRPLGVPAEKFHNRIDLAFWQILGTRFKCLGYSDTRKHNTFDQWIKRELSNFSPGVLHGWNGCMHETFRSKEATGWLRCVERSCPHNQFQYDLLKEEEDRVEIPHYQDMTALTRHIEELYLADVIICPSNYSANSYTDPVLKAKLRRVPLGGNFVMHERQHTPEKRLRILMVGNAFLRKGTHYLIEAMKYIDHPDTELWVRGEVPKSYRKQIKDSRIKFISPISQKKLQNLYSTADVFVQASVDEGFGMTVLEALSYGLPLVITENVGARDILNDKVAVTVPIRSPEAIAAAIPKALGLLGATFDFERKKILKTYTWQSCAEQLLKEAYVQH